MGIAAEAFADRNAGISDPRSFFQMRLQQLPGFRRPAFETVRIHFAHIVLDFRSKPKTMSKKLPVSTRPYQHIFFTSFVVPVYQYTTEQELFQENFSRRVSGQTKCTPPEAEGVHLVCRCSQLHSTCPHRAGCICLA